MASSGAMRAFRNKMMRRRVYDERIRRQCVAFVAKPEHGDMINGSLKGMVNYASKRCSANAARGALAPSSCGCIPVRPLPECVC